MIKVFGETNCKIRFLYININKKYSIANSIHLKKQNKQIYTYENH
jgi:hypothetical protein